MTDNRVLDRRQFLITAATGAGVSGAVATSPIRAATSLKATAGHHVHPVLIRNDHNDLLHLIVEVSQPDVRATSFTFSLRDTDELTDHAPSER